MLGLSQVLRTSGGGKQSRRDKENDIRKMAWAHVTESCNRVTDSKSGQIGRIQNVQKHLSIVKAAVQRIASGCGIWQTHTQLDSHVFQMHSQMVSRNVRARISATFVDAGDSSAAH